MTKIKVNQKQLETVKIRKERRKEGKKERERGRKQSGKQYRKEAPLRKYNFKQQLQ